MSYAIDFAPHLPVALLWLLGLAAFGLGIAAIVLRARGG